MRALLTDRKQTIGRIKRRNSNSITRKIGLKTERLHGIAQGVRRRQVAGHQSRVASHSAHVRTEKDFGTSAGRDSTSHMGGQEGKSNLIGS